MEAIDNQKQSPAGGSDNQLAACASARRARMVEGTDVVECLADDLICHCGFTFGDRVFCSHPSRNLIADGAMLEGYQATFPVS